jgi:L-threonylcarbamoyladenylate synthase
MKIFVLADGDEREIAVRVAARLANGEVGIVPTETVYGLMCAYGNSAGADRIFRMKARNPEKKLQTLVANIANLATFGIVPTPELKRLSQAFWPGPLTAIVDNARAETVGLRVPDHAFVQRVLSHLAAPLLATSANLSGTPPCTEAETAVEALADPPDFVVDGGPCNGLASTVVRLSAAAAPGQFEILRSGTISAEQITGALT